MERPDIDHYQAIGICHSAKITEIKETYADIALATHRNIKSGAAEKEALDEAFARISESFAVLSDARAKGSFDAKFKEYYASRHGCESCVSKSQRLWEELMRLRARVRELTDGIDNAVVCLEETEEKLAALQRELEKETGEGKKKDKAISSLKKQLAAASTEIRTLKNWDDMVEGTCGCGAAELPENDR